MPTTGQLRARRRVAAPTRPDARSSSGSPVFVAGRRLVHRDVVVGHPATPQRALVDRDEQLALALDGGLDQPGEQRVRPGRPRAQLGVRLRGHVVGVHVGRQLDELDQVVVRRGAGEHQAGGLELLAVGVVDLVAVPVPLLDPGRAVRRPHHAALLELGRVEAQPHGAAEVAGTFDEGVLLGHRRDHRLEAVGVELGGGGLVEAGLRAGRTRSPCTAGPGTGRAWGSCGCARRSARRACPRCRGCRSRRARRSRRPRRGVRAAPSGVSHSSEGIHSMLTLASWAKPPARSASTTER